jgi:hypothetical protein
MPQWRKLHVKATESLDINDMPDDFTRLLWVMLPLGLDCEGRGMDNPSWIKAKIMPLRMDVTHEMIECAMAWYENRDMIQRYEVNDRKYFLARAFKIYQGNTAREAPSSFPPPPREPFNSRVTHDQLLSNSSTEERRDRGDSEVEVDANGDGDFSEIPIPETPKEAAEHPDIRVFMDACGRIPGVKQYRVVIDTVRYLRTKYPRDSDLAGYLQRFWIAWSGRVGLTGKKYDPSSLVWLTEWATNGEIPEVHSRSPADGAEINTKGYTHA